MSDTLYVASSGAAARLKQLEVVANNLANVNTIGFRADRALFETALDAAWLDAEGEAVPGAPALSQVATHDVLTSEVHGSVSRTGAPLDAAVSGPGFFEVETPDGVRYTRAGSFVIDESGTLVTPSGFPVLGTNGTISAGTSELHIEGDGRIVDTQGTEVGRLSIVEFEESVALRKEGLNLFRAPDGEFGEPVDAHVIPGSVEMSNVQSVHELATLVILQRAFDASMQMLQATDELSQRLIQEASQ